MASTTETNGSSAPKRKARVSQADMPSVKLSEALRIPIAIRDNYGMQPATPVDIGVAIGIAPTSGGFRVLGGAALAFGLTTGGYNAAEIGLTDLGRRIVAPTEDGDDAVATREAFERPRIIKEFIARYNGSKLPASREVAQNVLHAMGVPVDFTERTYNLLLDGLQTYGYLKEVNGSAFVQRPQGRRTSAKPVTDEDEGLVDSLGEEDGVDADASIPPTPTTPPIPKQPNAIFLGHGKNRKPLEQLIKILDEYRIPHKEAMYEANAGRPIPTKVAETMRECGAAILIFTADERFRDDEDNEIWRPSENVVHELGAASVLYDNRIIIFKEAGVTLASNFSGIGHIGFEKDKLKDKGIELFRELVNFKIVNISVGGD